MSVASRATARAELQALLQQRVTDAASVPSTQPDDFGGQSPVVVVASGGSDRQRLTLRGTQPKFYLDVYVFVRATDTADAMLDLIEQEIAQAIEGAQDAASWMAIDYAGRSTTTFIQPVDGTEYKMERIPLQLTAR